VIFAVSHGVSSTAKQSSGQAVELSSKPKGVWTLDRVQSRRLKTATPPNDAKPLNYRKKTKVLDRQVSNEQKET
jgi:hypothetical protein